MSETLDIYDDNLVWLGTKPRDAVHRDGDWHRVFHCWVIYRGADGKSYLVAQRRGPHKDTFPDLIDVTAAGHYQAGESIADGVREVREELGIDARFEALIPLGVRVSAARYGGLIDREYADVFFLVYDQPITDYRVQTEEVAGLIACEVEAGLALCAGQHKRIRVAAAGLGADEIEVGLDDFIPTPDRYLYRILVLAQRYFNGEKHLVV